MSVGRIYYQAFVPALLPRPSTASINFTISAKVSKLNTTKNSMRALVLVNVISLLLSRQNRGRDKQLFMDYNEYIATYGTLGQKQELTEKIKRQREREDNMEFYGTIALVFLAGATFGIYLLGQLVMSSI